MERWDLAEVWLGSGEGKLSRIGISRVCRLKGVGMTHGRRIATKNGNRMDGISHGVRRGNKTGVCRRSRVSLGVSKCGDNALTRILRNVSLRMTVGALSLSIYERSFRGLSLAEASYPVAALLIQSS